MTSEGTKFMVVDLGGMLLLLSIQFCLVLCRSLVHNLSSYGDIL